MTFVVWEQPTSEAFERERERERSLRQQSPKHPEPKSVRHHWSLSVCVIWRLITLEDYESSSRLGVAFWASKSHCGLPGERSLWRFGSLPWRLTRVIGRGLCVLSSRGIRWRHGLLSWISASLTRHTVVTTTGTVPTNPVSSTSDWFYPFPPLLWVCLREVIAYLSYLFDFIAWLLLLIGFILSSILILLPSCF